ncbi:Type 1 glutamine amidotransferase-like domain-containing protein [Moorena producens JHB]|uniref:Type 1 glutamine amidotransferase-like domain-containing protein n=1 Tax=Moorena producens (strain JHB) TaxID=1454205 RepID=A0A1D9G7V2_MOOP1|nr:Type 1 glutamine amidotransferase-like domain-containing protein [Moorena producens]AOY83698.2 Type 1 glutamine amidotransferase-like domain-containing protein [Moorena producens JHB]
MKRLVITALVFVIMLGVVAFPAAATVKRYQISASPNVGLSLDGPAFDLGGGGPDVDEAIQWMINEVRDCSKCDRKVDVVVIRSFGGDGYNEPIYDMDGVNSVETLVLDSRDDANRPDVVATVENAEVLFFTGGNQCDYVENFQDTDLHDAIAYVLDQGGAIGGTSAGAMIQGNFVYDSCQGSVTFDEALNDPYNDYISFTNHLFQWRDLESVIVDTHFSERERMGRLMVFIARQLQDTDAEEVLGIGVDEATSVVVNYNGYAEVIGEGAAYFVLGDHIPEECEPGIPLSFSNYKIWKLSAGDTFDLRYLPTSGYEIASVEEGIISFRE